MSDRDDLDRALRLLASEQHPDAEDLTAYQAGELDGVRAEEVRGHLDGCEACRGRMAELAVFLEGPTAPPGREATAAWQRLQGRLEDETWRDGTPFRPSGFFAWLRAAPPLRRINEVILVVVVCVIAFIVYAMTTGPSWFEVHLGPWSWGPSTETTVALDLLGGTRGGPPVTTVQLQPRTGKIELWLRLEPGTSFATYRVEILDAAGNPVHAARRLEARDGIVSVAVPRRKLEVGTVYLVRVFGPGDEPGNEAGEAAFRLGNRPVPR